MPQFMLSFVRPGSDVVQTTFFSAEQFTEAMDAVRETPGIEPVCIEEYVPMRWVERVGLGAATATQLGLIMLLAGREVWTTEQRGVTIGILAAAIVLLLCMLAWTRRRFGSSTPRSLAEALSQLPTPSPSTGTLARWGRLNTALLPLLFLVVLGPRVYNAVMEATPEQSKGFDALLVLTMVTSTMPMAAVLMKRPPKRAAPD